LRGWLSIQAVLAPVKGALDGAKVTLLRTRRAG
jgi:hypothetical protein